MECLDRNCNNCGIHCLILMQGEIDNSESALDVKWERYEHAILEIDGEESTDDNPSIVTEQLFVFSPDDSHDMYFTHFVRKLVVSYLSSISASVTTIHKFTDGCQAQYKKAAIVLEILVILEETDFEAEDETAIKDLVNRGCIIAVVADDPNDDYFLLKASGKTQILNVDSTDKWAAHFRKSIEIIRGLYFDKLTVEDGVIKFKLLQRKTALVQAISTRFICIDLKILGMKEY
ncbi:unnamed protein product [Mytilus coruscus]|uniref:Uncharacterized protein n=1 Tax=Mytilus coruscus TaxID=42192 RepID=A0A6J8DAL5_MYTCO|nr:unnamed protein product [Mytilus coruscus]